MVTTIDPVMRKFRAALDEAYGDRIERVVLFGSRARGDARPDSDYDVAVFLRGMESFGREVSVIELVYARSSVVPAPVPFSRWLVHWSLVSLKASLMRS